jgi:hypothetical protein
MTTRGCHTPWASLRTTRLTRRSAARNPVSKANGVAPSTAGDPQEKLASTNTLRVVAGV